MSRKSEWIMFFIFVAVNIILFVFSVDTDAPLSVGADAGQYLRPARSLVDYGMFAMNPPEWTPEMGEARPFTFGVPLYSILLAVPYYFFGQADLFYIMVIIIQCCLLYLTGWISRSLLPFFNSNRTILIHALIVFNPNSLITAHLIQSETLFTFLLVVVLLYIFKYIKNNSTSNLMAIGLSVGLLALTRPAGLYLVYMIPIILLVIQVFNILKSRNKIKFAYRPYFSIFIPLLVAFLVISPWYARNYVNTGEYFFTTTSGYFLFDNHIQLLQKGSGYTNNDAVNKARSQLLTSLQDTGKDTSCVNRLRDFKCHKLTFNLLLSHVVNQPLEAHTKALLYSWATLYFTGGASNIRNYLGFSGNSLIVAYQNEKFDGINSILKLFNNAETSYIVLLFITMLFVFVVRTMAFIGIYRIIKDKEGILYLIVLFSVLLLFTAMYLYLGQSRFRVPLEPILMLLAVLGLSIDKNKNKH